MKFRSIAKYFLCLSLGVLLCSYSVHAEGLINNKDLLFTMRQCYWENYDTQFKKDLLYVLVYNCAEALGTDIPVLDYYYEDIMDDGSLSEGKFDYTSNTIYINEYDLFNSSICLEAISHEMRHYYQWNRACNPSNDLDYMYLDNFNNYISSSSEGYKSQLLEVDADNFANAILLEFINCNLE